MYCVLLFVVIMDICFLIDINIIVCVELFVPLI